MIGRQGQNTVDQEPTGYPGAPLESYLEKLLTPLAEPLEWTPREEPLQEEMPSAALQETEPSPVDEIERQPIGREWRLDPSEAAGTPRESKPLWQTAGEEPPTSVIAPRNNDRSAGRKSRVRSYTPRTAPSAGRQKLMTALIPVLVIGLVAALKNPLGARPTVQAADQPPKGTAPAAIPDVQITWEIPPLYGLDGRDPMQPAPHAVENPETMVPAAQAQVDLVVRGILHSADRPAAIIDTQIVYEGQQVSGATVEKIDPDGVQFEKSGRKWKQGVDQ